MILNQDEMDPRLDDVRGLGLLRRLSFLRDEEPPCFSRRPSQPRPLLPVARRSMGLVKKCSLIIAFRLLSKRVVKVSGESYRYLRERREIGGVIMRRTSVACCGE